MKRTVTKAVLSSILTLMLILGCKDFWHPEGSQKGLDTPTGVTATATSSSSITISWNSVSEAGRYWIYRSSSADGNYSLEGSSISTSFTDTGVFANTTYYYKVEAHGNKNNSSKSSYASARTGSGPDGVPGEGLEAKLSWLQSNAQSGGEYVIGLIDIHVSDIEPHTFSYSGKSNITITLKSTGSTKTITSYYNYSVLTVGSGVTLVLDNIILGGIGVDVSSGSLIMNTGSTITDCIHTQTGSGIGGGVSVGASGTFTMNGGTISGNHGGSSGGGVYVNGGTFTMNGGTISGNHGDPSGGGVYVNGGTFTMSGGTISGNTAISSYDYDGKGGGVYVVNGTFTKTGGTITGYASDTVNGNVVENGIGVVQSGLGHAVYACRFNNGSILGEKRKENTAGPAVNLSYNGKNGVFTGSWDN